MKMNDTVSNNEDLRSLLLTLHFWVAGCNFVAVLGYMMSGTVQYCEATLEEFYPDFPGLRHISLMALSAKPIVPAIESGIMEYVKYFLDRGHFWPKRACDMIAKTGNVEMMKCALHAGCLVSILTSEIAALAGHLNCLRYLRERGARWKKAKVIAAAARGGHLPCLQYAHQQGQPLLSEFYTFAVVKSNFEMMRYLHENGCAWDKHACRTAAATGNFPFLQFIHEHGGYWDTEVCRLASERRDLNMVLYLLRNGCLPSDNIWTFQGTELEQIHKCFVDAGLPWSATPEALPLVIHFGSFESLQYLVENGCPWHFATTTYITVEKNVEMLRYVHEKGCPWSLNICLHAAFWGSLECLEYAHTHGAVMENDMCDKLLKSHNNNPKTVLFECFKYLHQHGGGKLLTEHTYYAACNGYLEILKYLHEQGCEWDSRAAHEADQNGHKECLEYILRHGGTNTRRVWDMEVTVINGVSVWRSIV